MPINIPVNKFKTKLIMFKILLDIFEDGTSYMKYKRVTIPHKQYEINTFFCYKSLAIPPIIWEYNP